MGIPESATQEQLGFMAWLDEVEILAGRVFDVAGKALDLFMQEFDAEDAARELSNT